MGYFSTEQLKNVRLVISHGNNCPDGIASAMIVGDAYADEERPEFKFVDHGSEGKQHLEPIPRMMFVDFSPLPEKAQAFIDAGAICLDHHVKGSSVQAFVAAGLGVFGDEKTEPGVCGATLAYEHVWKPLMQERPHYRNEAEPHVAEMARLSGIRDTWQKHDPDWTTACAQAEALRFWPVETLLELHPSQWDSKLSLGEILWSRKLNTAAKISHECYRWRSPAGNTVAIFPGVRWSSDVAEALGSRADLVIAYDIVYEDGGFKIICSSRSRGTFDCGALALAHGGGGHTLAAGFAVPMTLDSPNPYRVIQDTLAKYEVKSASGSPRG